MKTKFFEESERYLVFFKKKGFVCEVTVLEPNTFGMIFSTATSKLKEWYEANKGAAKSFRLQLSSPPLVLKAAQQAMQNLYASNDSYAFVKKLQLSIVHQNTDTGEIKTYYCEKE